MKLIEAVNANLAAQEMSQQRLPYDLALAVVKVKRATADETDFFLREERALVEEYADTDENGNIRMTGSGRFAIRGSAQEYEKKRKALADTETKIDFIPIEVTAPAEIKPALIEALDRPEAQTRWEALDALTALATTCPEQLGDAFEGAETALFDEISSTLRYAAFRLLCVWGATSVERSREAWPILDEAIQCYHGDLEYRDMLGCLYEFGQGEIDAEVAEKLALRLKFDAENGKGSYLKARSSEICEMLVKRFDLDLSKKKKRASVKKSDDAENEE